VQDFFNKIAEYLRSPVRLEAELSVAKMIVIGAAAIAGGALATMIFPGLLLLGAIEAVSAVAAGGSAVAGAVGAGYLARTLVEEHILDENYHQVLQCMVHSLSQVWEADPSKMGSKEFQTVSDYRLMGDTYSLEKALLLLYSPSQGLHNFDGTIMGKSSKASLEKLLTRALCYKTFLTVIYVFL